MKELMRTPNPRTNGGPVELSSPQKKTSSDTLSVMTAPATPHTQSDIVEVKTCLDRLAQLLQHHAPEQTLQPPNTTYNEATKHTLENK